MRIQIPERVGRAVQAHFREVFPDEELSGPLAEFADELSRGLDASKRGGFLTGEELTAIRKLIESFKTGEAVPMSVGVMAEEALPKLRVLEEKAYEREGDSRGREPGNGDSRAGFPGRRRR